MKYKYLLPSEDVNDENAIITEQFFNSGDKVKKSDLIYSFETTKAVVDVESNHSGYIFYTCDTGDQLNVGECVCNIFKNKSAFDKAVKTVKKVKKYTLTKKAEKFVDENKINLSELDISGIVKINDIKRIISKANSNFITPKLSFKDNDIIILGNGGHSKVCNAILEKQSLYNFKGFISKNNKSFIPEDNVIGCDDMLIDFYNQGLKNVVIGIGDISSKNKNRELLYNEMKKIGYNIPNIIDQKSIIENSCNFGEANQVMAGAILGSDCLIGNNNIINSGAIICHDSILNNNIHIAPGAIIAAEVNIGDNTLIGMGATIYRGIKIGENVVIGNGQNIINNVKDNEIIY